MECFRFRTPTEIRQQVRRLVAKNLAILYARGYMSILEGNVRYVAEKNGQNCYLTIEEVIALGYGDCEDLAAALIAQYLYLGYNARELIECQKTSPKKTLCHISLEVFFNGHWVDIDISALLGMPV